MLTEKDYCDYDICVALKELGYKVPTSAYYMPHHKDLIWVSNPFRGGYVTDYFYSHNSLPKGVMTSNYIDAPTMWEAQKWLREEHNLHIDVRLHGIIGYQCEVCTSERTITVGREFLTYEDALSEGLRKAIEILKILKEK